MVLGDPANTVLQPSIRDVMKACTRVFADSASSDRCILRIYAKIEYVRSSLVVWC